MAIMNPTQLVEEFKKSGEFDRLRRELLAQFRSSDGIIPLMSRVEDITRQKLASDQKLQYMSEAAVSRELMQELDRYPIVERAVADVRALSDPSFASGIRESVRKILQEDRRGKPQSDPPTSSTSDPMTTELTEPAHPRPSTNGLNSPAKGSVPHPSQVPSQDKVPEDEKTRAVRFVDAVPSNAQPADEDVEEPDVPERLAADEHSK
ncbi:hypothetical protein AcW1_004237 [Taiwanofungus camphoratus]|nr:hypothetical protein AcW2_006752 [Antrodia cinnamomea]KAI0939113.1 hypothetical protein AcV5_000618 [Antrodia cinnamomea]KAI0952033.1 hypothetical protein AcV7_007960 [Antrodia cinnamomea]KAI0959408.1 hypothetical protein AcW1_004237 [Antrodia cinnamomea]